MLGKTLINLLKRKRRDEEPAAQSQENAGDTQNENVFTRAFRKIKRRIFRACQVTNVHAHCIEMSPASTSSAARYEVTPAPAQKLATVELLPREYVLDDYINIRESRIFEFKTGGGQYPIQVLPEHIRKYGSGFLNSEGGVLIAGIMDNGRVRGIYMDKRLERRIMDTLDKEVSQFYPHVERSLYSIHFVPVYDRRARTYLRNTKVIEIVFKGGDPLALYETGDHKVFLRREGSVEGPLSPLRIKDVVLRKYRKVLDERRIKEVTLLSP